MVSFYTNHKLILNRVTVDNCRVRTLQSALQSFSRLIKLGKVCNSVYGFFYFHQKKINFSHQN